MSRPRKNGLKTPTQADLHELLDYDVLTGIFTWKKNRGDKAKSGTIAGYRHGLGYVRISVYGRIYLAHRLAWMYSFGSWPESDIDHINGVKSDNRICNLRECLHYENHQNIGKRGHNTSGYLGVTKTAYGTWAARIVCKGKRIYVGTYPTAEEAAAAYLQAKSQHHTFQPIPRGA